MMQNSVLERKLINKLKGKYLTKQQHFVALGLLDGLSNKEIAAKMSLQVKSVKASITMIYKKTGHKNRNKFITALYKSLLEIGDLPMGN